MNLGTAGRSTVGSGVGATGANAASTATGTIHRAIVGAARPASIAIAMSTANSGPAASANRLGSAAETPGSPSTRANGSVTPVCSPLTTRFGPSASTTIPAAAAAHATAAGRRQSHSVIPATASSSGIPKNPLYSAGSLDRLAAAWSPPRASGEIVVRLAASRPK
jgi:hypothetical protein